MLRKRWIGCGGVNRTLRPSDAIAASMMRCYFVKRRSFPLLSLSDYCCTTMTGKRDYAFWSHIATLLNNSVISKWYCGAAVMGVVIGMTWCEELLLNKSLVCFSLLKDRRGSATLVAFTVRAWRKSSTAFKSAAMASIYWCTLVFPYSIFLIVSSSSPDSFSPSLYDFLAAASDPRSDILVAKILMISADDIFHSSNTTSVTNGNSITSFWDT